MSSTEKILEALTRMPKIGGEVALVLNHELVSPIGLAQTAT